MRVLITNAILDHGGGTQTYVRDLATWLLDHGHSPFVYSPILGDGAVELRQRTIPVTDDLDTVSVLPDIIHGNSSVETVIALLHFPQTPAVFVCHSWGGLAGAPPRFKRVRRYIAVDDTCGDRLLIEHGLPAGRVSVLLNGVDVDRFPRRDPLPPRPKRAAVFGNAAHELTHLSLIRDACREAGIEVDAIGAVSGNYTSNPEELLGQYDLVFAKAKCAMEAMVSGAAVILCDAAGIGGMVRAYDVARLRRVNFGFRSLATPLSVEALAREIAAYDADDAAQVSELMRGTARNDALHESLLSVYADVVEEHRHAAPVDRNGESRSAAEFIERMAISSRHSHDQINVVLRASQRIMSMPVIGRGMTKAARWLIGKRKKKY